MGRVKRLTQVGVAATRLLLSPEQRARVDALAASGASAASAAPDGFDALGMHPDGVALGLALTNPAYRSYFRVRSHHAERIPKHGGAILVANHAGTLPFDAAMLWADVFQHTDPPRVLRPVADFFVAQLPLATSVLSRIGVVNGSRGNVAYLLERGELLLIFPEGMEAIGKSFRHRYRIRRWTEGHAEMAIRHRVPVVPVAIIGSEEQWPQLGRIHGPLPFGIPYVPLTATPLPLPVRYDIYYGEPIHLAALYPPDAARTPAAIDEAARRTRTAIEGLIAEGRRLRRGVFR